MADIGKILILPKGDYNAFATYNILDVVRSNGKAWLCKQNNVSGVAPSESDYWMMLVQDGAGGSGSGDMTKQEYATNQNFGVVDTAVTLDGLTATIANLNQTSSLDDLAFIGTDGISSTKYLQGDGSWQTFPTIPTVTDTYDGTSSNAMSGKAVKSAIDALDGVVSGSAGTGKTLTVFSQTDGKVTATFGNISITKSQVSDFPAMDEWLTTTATVSSGAFSFGGLDDTKGWAFKPYAVVNGSSTNKNPTCEISSITGAGTSSMTVSYTTDADNGATIKLRIIK